MNIQRKTEHDEWEVVASTGFDPEPLTIYRLHDMNTVFEFINARSEKDTKYRVILPDRDWLKRTDIRES